jgi:hypothetical protein
MLVPGERIFGFISLHPLRTRCIIRVWPGTYGRHGFLALEGLSLCSGWFIIAAKFQIMCQRGLSLMMAALHKALP